MQFETGVGTELERTGFRPKIKMPAPEHLIQKLQEPLKRPELNLYELKNRFFWDSLGIRF